MLVGFGHDDPFLVSNLIKIILPHLALLINYSLCTSYLNLRNKIRHTEDAANFVIYGGNDTQHWPQATVMSWKSSGEIIKTIGEAKNSAG